MASVAVVERGEVGSGGRRWKSREKDWRTRRIRGVLQ